MASDSEITTVFKRIDHAITNAEISALNMAARSARADLIKFVRKKYPTKAKDLRDYIKIIKANRSRRYVTLAFGNKKFGLHLFKASQSKKGVRATEQIGKRKVYPGTFIAEMKYGLGVFKREGKKRGPVKFLFGPDPQQILTSEVAHKHLEQSLIENCTNYYYQRLAYYVTK
ncbi:MAG: hypothetical protein A2V66_03605 [Ignavibacteria bacterium RBG_13_36_8]|nr:MAG: hypothetical protein A2V66_03605 [Ignavibacteria bacterium RBG_13_36_8]